MRPRFIHDCDVIVVNYNVGTLLGECVASAFREGARRVIVVDNASSDGSLAYLDGCLADTRLSIIRNQRNMGFASACNTGVGVSSAGALLFLNPDCVLLPGSLQGMMEALHADAATGMVGAFYATPMGPNSRAGVGCFRPPGEHSSGLLAYRAWMECFPRCAPTSCCIVSRCPPSPPRWKPFPVPACWSSVKR